MKKLLIAIVLMVTAISVSAQTYTFQSFDNSVKDGWWDLSNLYSNQGSATAKLDVSDYTADKKEGTGSVKIDYLVGAGDGWGGYIVRTTPKPLNVTYDLSVGKQLTFWYKVIKPVVTSQGGSLEFELKLTDANETGGEEDRFFRKMPIDFADASGTWKQITVDMNIGSDPTVSWAPQAQNGDGELQLHKINIMEIAIVYITTGGGVNTPTAAGEILIDGLAVVGDKYAPPLDNFDASAASYAFDDMGWAGAGKGEVKLTDVTNDKVEGAGALKFDYTVNASEDWGGYVNFSKNITKPEKFEERTALVVWIKNVTPHKAANPGRLSMRFNVIENNTGSADEGWVCMVPIDWSKATNWVRVYMPLRQRPPVEVGTEKMFPSDGFAQPWWDEKGDKTFNPEAIKGIKIELSAEGLTGPTGGGVKGEKLTGTILFDIIQQSGFQSADKQAPTAPALAVVKGTYSNLVTWTDVAGESEEKYHLYFSTKPITDINSTDVSTLKLNVGENVQVFEHLLRSPKVDRDETYYYAITCADKAGNVSDPAVSGAFVNKAKGIPTIALQSVNFKADGKLDEWKGITPFDMSPSKGTATIVNNFVVTDDNDCSAKVYVAIDNNYLYIAFDVTDDVVYDDPGYYTRGNSWALDATDLEIGLYNGNEHKIHTGYMRGAAPDYHVRFNKLRARNDHWTSVKDSLLLPGPNYYWGEKFPSGYVVEAKISLDDLANVRTDPAAAKDKIYLKKGYKIPFDLVINDNDGGTSGEDWQNRQGMISWGPFNQDGGWQYPQNWMYTWLGDDDVVVTDLDEQLPFAYNLDQNYPNPFNPATQINYSIANAGLVTLRVYDVLGRQVAELINRYQDAGSYNVNFNASKLTSGIYFYKIESGSFVQVKKMMLVK